MLHALNGFLIRQDIRHVPEPGDFGAKSPCGKLRTGPRVVRIRLADLSRAKKDEVRRGDRTDLSRHTVVPPLRDEGGSRSRKLSEPRNRK